MSGGSFNYLYQEDIEIPSELRRMVETMKPYPALHGYLKGILNKIEEARDLFRKNEKLFHDIEWYVSSDIGEKDMMETFIKTLKGEIK